jgi:tetratricopeptide (TPR) repeat protein
MLRDRGVLVARGQTWELIEGAQIPFPEGIHGIISARLDALAPDRKALLLDASVIGKVFWSGALEAMSDRPASWIREVLDELTAKEFLRQAPTSSMEGEREHSFWHMLVRDAAYAQIPRAARADKHVAVTNWLEDRAGGRVEDLADVLAYHSFEALKLARAAGADVSGLDERARRFLVLAGDRAKGLDAERALVMYERALELAPDEDPMRGEILHGVGVIEWTRGLFGRARAHLEEAISALLAAGRPTQAADAKLMLSVVMTTIAPGEADWRLLAEATAELEHLPPGEELVRAYALQANWVSAMGQYVEAIAWADRSISLARDLELPSEPWALIQRGGARCWSGDMNGLEDIHRGVDLALDQGTGILAAMGRNQVAEVLRLSTGPAAAMRELQAAGALARRVGAVVTAEYSDVMGMSEALYLLGRWEEMLDVSAPYLADDRKDALQIRLGCQTLVCSVATWRGDFARSTELSHVLHRAAKEFDAPWPVVELAVVAHLALAVGDVDRSADVLRELEAYPHMREDWTNVAFLPEITRVALRVVGLEFAKQLATGISPSPMALPRISLEMVDAELAEAQGELEQAAQLYASAEEGWRTFSIPERAQSLLGRGRCLLATGNPESEAVLREARRVFASLEAKLFLPEVDLLLAEAAARSS